MSHQAIYRKFRPKVFDDVLGQEHVTKTLKNQILTNNVAHAYLFSGIRGTGKTSTAKIFARAVNCINNHDGNPCNECDICKSILDETNMDVIEMDAASNNGVDDIRDLRDKVKFLPVKSRFKVYIIDEVHMLSKGAFNALLKTLEEPPEHLLFILATTEPHKIPATILSRCQRFDLKRISSTVIVENMKNICEEINIDYDEKALKLIAANSEGAMRDALSILDRCVSFNEEKIYYDTVINLLGTVNYELVLESVNHIINKDIKSTMLLVDDILNMGKEISIFLDELIICFRNILIIKTTNSTDNVMRISDVEAQELKSIASKIKVDDIVAYIEELSITQLECKRAINPRVLLETKLISMLNNIDKSNNDLSVVNDVNIKQLINRIAELENYIKANKKLTNKEYLETKKELTTEKEKTNKIIETKSQVKELNVENEINDSKQEHFENKSDEAIYNSIINGWQTILKKIRIENAGLQAIIRESKLNEVINQKIIFEFDPKFTFHINAANQSKNKQKFKEILSGFLNSDCEVEFIIKNEKKPIQPKKSIEDVYEDLVSNFGEEIVEFKQED